MKFKNKKTHQDVGIKLEESIAGPADSIKEACYGKRLWQEFSTLCFDYLVLFSGKPQKLKLARVQNKLL